MRTAGTSPTWSHRLRSFLPGGLSSSAKEWAFFALACGVGLFLGQTVTNASNPLLLPLALIVGLAALYLMLNLNVCMVIFLFFMYSRTPSVLAGDHGVRGAKQLVIAFAMVTLVVFWLRRRTLPRNWLPAVLFASGYILSWYMSYQSAYDLELAKEQAAIYVKATVPGFLLIFMMRDHNAARTIVWTFLAVGIFLGTLCSFQQLSGTFDKTYWGFATAAESFEGEGSYRIAGPFGDPNYFGLILIPLVPLALDRFWSTNSSPRQRFFAVWCLSVSILTIVFTYSRGAFLGLAAAIVVTFIRRPPKPSSLAMTAVLTLLLLVVVPANYRDRILSIDDVFSTFDDEATEKSTVSGRASEAVAAWRMFSDHPLLGVGVGNYPPLYPIYAADLGISGHLGERAAHSLYLELAAETGLVGIAGFGFLMIGVFTSLSGAYRKLKTNGMDEEANLTDAFRAGLIGYLVSSTFLSAAVPMYFWLMVGSAFGLKKIADRVPARTS